MKTGEKMEQNAKKRIEVRDKEEKKKIITRLRVIEGQVRGIQQMVDLNRTCEDILTQISAIEKSLQSVGASLLEEHLENDVTKRIQANDKEVIKQVMELIKRYQV